MGQMMVEYSSLTRVFFPTNKNSEIEERYRQGLAESLSKKEKLKIFTSSDYPKLCKINVLDGRLHSHAKSRI
ncbi:hypothetical protein OIU77_016624 [Salix suchowensis]|uniref:Uncharacterized protein n=1 Tax=Salix suchowensis TaxID=1278906 RepID=A0ABQ8ZL13_9ROSI|nr:hypothetical protein OIU77_016624 [Salix suchowensis]